ncbi:MAG: helix-hairpin-helix domain-containing protein [Paludibacteraceae bacterium]|nr:helix-hairpin-helix domain-containing protein [Paludibacteraceae bacterium]
MKVLTRNQWIGIVTILVLLVIIYVLLHWLPSPQATPDMEKRDTAVSRQLRENKRAYFDSLDAARTAHYDALRLARRDSLHRVHRYHRDSMRRADSLWWDSVRRADTIYVRAVKKDTVLELNSADTVQLQWIRGIGPSMARRIVRYREQLGGFASVRQLQDREMYLDRYGRPAAIKYCLADSTLKNFRVETDSVRQIEVNRASVNRLQQHPYISFTLAKQIYNLRREKIRIPSMDELQRLLSMPDSTADKLKPYLNFDKQ